MTGRGLLLLFPLWCISFVTSAQEKSDSVKTLDEVVVEAYATDRPVNEVGASVVYINQKTMERFSNTSLLPVVNTIPGVRMEERSPGSYRFSLRGSLLRSPFGVRNVKMYWNGLPLTDGGGNTYINLLDFNSLTSIEIIKGPGASLYGAGTGGVVLLKNTIPQEDQISLSLLGGSYGLHRYVLSGVAGSEDVRIRIQYAHQDYDGYRDHTAMRRDILNADLNFRISEKTTLKATIFNSDLFYETPGGLTKAQFDEDASKARARADELKASISNKTFYGGASLYHQWNESWSTQLGAYASSTDFENPTFLNFERRSEKNFGGRLSNQYIFERERWTAKLTFGGEFQELRSPIINYGNIGGEADTLIFDDDLSSIQSVLFAQTEFDLPLRFILTAGISSTFLKLNMVRNYPDDEKSDLTSKFDPVFSPRVSLLKKINANNSAYVTISSGFSPPTLAEVRPSSNEYNSALKPEHGINYEIGFKGQIKSGAFQYDISLFQFDLKETIVIQRTSNNAEYFVNAGSTRQRGIEAMVRSKFFQSELFTISGFGSFTLNNFYFDDYTFDAKSYSGNRLTGVAPNVLALGLDLSIGSFYMNTTANYTDHVPLNDANTDFASEYYLLGSRIGYRGMNSTRFPIDVFVGADNLFDSKYSLGNDLNARPAAAPRYYNVAPGRNFYFGVKVNALFSKR